MNMCHLLNLQNIYYWEDMLLIKLSSTWNEENVTFYSSHARETYSREI